MRKLPFAAAALLFGTSAYAMAPSTEPTGVQVDKDPYTVMGTGAGTTAIGTAGDSFKLQPATADWWDKAEPVAVAADDDDLKTGAAADSLDAAKAGLELASSDEFAADDEEWNAIAAQKAEADSAAAPEPEVDPDTAETTVLDDEPVPVENGVGGPDEALDMAAADLTPRPASQNYPACRPGPGDDRCIQLYEPGVREQLAAWDQPTGGFAGMAETRMAAADVDAADRQVAVGGPYEPVDDAAMMNGDGTVDTAMGETEADEKVEV